MNLVVLYGRLTRDPELRYSQNGMANTFATVAVDRGMSREKRQEAEASGQPTADFIGIKAFGKTAELLGNYFHKGNRIAVEGRISTGSYEKNGGRVYTTDVVVNRVHFIESAKESGSGAGAGNMAPPTNMAYQSNSGNQSNNPSASGFGPKSDDEGYYPIDNNDIPF
ncbi:single-stranded DNA-binding protein [Aedoeadaptatus urinae]|uniref:single-stranded DNA-binding protein n=1 Tax=Aedoeadaptatus urinae TaxID=1871017 RepID=UPI00097DF209|nr:single-stranded DNA-binding protein [Peptoniphilus urinae]